MSASDRKRPFGATILAILAGVLAVIAGIHTLQSLGILPFFIGDFSFRAFSFFNALMWGLMVWVYVWLIQMLWRVDPQAWLFLAVITVFNLILDFMLMLGAGEWNDVSVSFIINGLILIYVMLPGTRRAFQRG
jgi:drug/metabolite transporter (DMT)-like permease